MHVRGDSMYPDFRDGDIVLVLKQNTMNHSGEIGVISYGDDEMTIKRINYVQSEDWLELVPLKPVLQMCIRDRRKAMRSKQSRLLTRAASRSQ